MTVTAMEAQVLEPVTVLAQVMALAQEQEQVLEPVMALVLEPVQATARSVSPRPM